MRHSLFLPILLAVLLVAPTSHADEPTAASLQERINAKYRNYFGPDSQMLLPFPTLEMKEWKTVQSQKALKRIYSEPGKYYNGKVYTFTLYQADDAAYYLDAKGGFWGMDELLYGPIAPGDLQ